MSNAFDGGGVDLVVGVQATDEFPERMREKRREDERDQY